MVAWVTGRPVAQKASEAPHAQGRLKRGHRLTNTMAWASARSTEYFDVLPVTETCPDQNRAAHDSGAAWFARPDTGVEHVGKASSEPVSGCVVLRGAKPGSDVIQVRVAEFVEIDVAPLDYLLP